MTERDCSFRLGPLNDIAPMEVFISAISLRRFSCLKSLADLVPFLVVDGLNGCWIKFLAKLLFRRNFRVIFSPLSDGCIR